MPSEPSKRYKEPIFYTDQRYSEITKSPSDVHSDTPSDTYRALKRLVEEKRARLISDEPLFREPLKPLPYLSGNERVPYVESTVRRLDGPYTTYEEPETPPPSKKRRVVKLKLKKPVRASAPEEPVERVSRFSYEPSSFDSYEPSVESEPERRQDYFRHDTYKARKPATTPPPVSEDPKYNYEPVMEPRYDYKPPTSYVRYDSQPSFKKESYDSQPTYKKDSYDSQPSYKKESYEPYKDYRQQVQQVRQNVDYLEQPERRQGSSSSTGFVGDRPNFLDQGFNIPSAFKDNLQSPAFADFRPPFGGFSDFLKNFPEDPFISSRTNNDFFSASVTTGDEEPRSIPSPTNQFSPKSLKTISSEVNSFEFPNIQEYSKPTFGESPTFGFYSNDEINYDKTTKAPATTTEIYKPSYEPSYEPVTEDVYKPSYNPIKEETYKPISYKPVKAKPSYKPEEPKPMMKEKPTYKPIEEDYKPTKLVYGPGIKPDEPFKPSYKPTKENYKYKVETYRKPIGQPDYEIVKTTTTTTTTTTPAPTTGYTESSVYYKPVEEVEETSVYYKPMEETELTPGPVYYKPIDESTPTTTPAAAPIISSQEETVATAPKAPPPKIPLGAPPHPPQSFKNKEIKKPIHNRPPRKGPKKPIKSWFPKLPTFRYVEKYRMFFEGRKR